MSGFRTGFQEACTRGRKRVVGMNDPHIRCKRSLWVSGRQYLRKMDASLPFFLRGKQLCSEACRRSKSLELSMNIHRDLDITLTNKFLNKSESRLDTVIVFLNRREEQRDDHPITQDL